MRLTKALLFSAFLFVPGLTLAGPPRHLVMSRRPTVVYYYAPYASPVLVVSPYAPGYFLPPAVVVTAPYFCVLHNEGFVSRIGLLDHLVGTHKIALAAAVSICPDGAASCVFPSY